MWMGTCYFSLSAVTQDHTEHRSSPSRSPPAKFPCGFFTLWGGVKGRERKKKQTNTDVELKVFIFPSPLGSFIDPALPNTNTSEVRGGGGKKKTGWLPDGGCSHNRNIFPIRTGASRRSEGKCGGEGWRPLTSDALLNEAGRRVRRACRWTSARGRKPSASGPGRLRVVQAPSLFQRASCSRRSYVLGLNAAKPLFLLTDSDRNSTRDGSSAAYTPISDAWGGKKKKGGGGPQVQVVHWGIFNIFPLLWPPDELLIVHCFLPCSQIPSPSARTTAMATESVWQVPVTASQGS